MAHFDEPWTIRAPWADEEQRLKRHFPRCTTPSGTKPVWRQVIEATEPRRLVGLVLLNEITPAPDTSGAIPGARRKLVLRHEPRAAWRDHAAVGALLDAALERARALGARELLFSTRPGGMPESWARALGFVEVRRREIWRVPVDALLAKLLDRGTRMLAHAPVEIGAIRAPMLEGVREICVAAKLLTAERVTVDSPGRPGLFDPSLSFFAGSAEKPGAVLLAHERAGVIYMEALARAPSARDLPDTAIIGLLKAFFQAASELGHDEVHAHVVPGQTPGLIRQVARVGGTCHDSVLDLRLDLET